MNFIAFPSQFQYGIWVYGTTRAQVTLWLWMETGLKTIWQPIFSSLHSHHPWTGPASPHDSHWQMVSLVIWSLEVWTVVGGPPWLMWPHSALIDAKGLWLPPIHLLQLQNPLAKKESSLNSQFSLCWIHIMEHQRQTKNTKASESLSFLPHSTLCFLWWGCHGELQRARGNSLRSRLPGVECSRLLTLRTQVT